MEWWNVVLIIRLSDYDNGMWDRIVWECDIVNQIKEIGNRYQKMEYGYKNQNERMNEI